MLNLLFFAGIEKGYEFVSSFQEMTEAIIHSCFLFVYGTWAATVCPRGSKPCCFILVMHVRFLSRSKSRVGSNWPNLISKNSR